MPLTRALTGLRLKPGYNVCESACILARCAYRDVMELQAELLSASISDVPDLHSMVTVASCCVCVRGSCENVSRTDEPFCLNGRNNSKSSTNNGHAPRGAIVFNVCGYAILSHIGVLLNSRALRVTSQQQVRARFHNFGRSREVTDHS